MFHKNQIPEMKSQPDTKNINKTKSTIIPKIGLEIHGYLRMSKTKKKLFCNCNINQDSESNTNVCPVCTAQPGSKPMLPNKEAVDKIIKCGLFLDCKISKKLMFQRKHYDWPDLPNGFQKTMSGSYSFPVGTKGTFLGIGIQQIHLEEDPAKWDPKTGLVDYNRCGFPLAEIVTDPDFTSPEQVVEWLKSLLNALSYIDAIDSASGIKCDVNISIPPNYIRAEIKNVNSLKSIAAAINFEVKRQHSEKMDSQETRMWNDEKQATFFMRKKEQAADYRFIPEPDLPTIFLEEKYIQSLNKTLPEKPDQKIKKFEKAGISKENAKIIASDISLAELFETVLKKIDPKLAERWFRSELLRVLNYQEKAAHEVPMTSENLVELLDLLQKGDITDTVAKKILEQLMEKSFSPKEFIKKQGLQKVDNSNELESMCKKALDSNPKAIEDFKKGEEKALNFLVGQIMKQTKGAADPAKVLSILKKLIK